MMSILIRYMTGMLGSTDFTWHWHTGAAPWEEKVAELLPFISSVEDRYLTILVANQLNLSDQICRDLGGSKSRPSSLEQHC